MLGKIPNISEQSSRLLWSVHDLQALGFSRSAAYQLLNRDDLPVIHLGGRRFMHAEKFRAWLDEQAKPIRR